MAAYSPARFERRPIYLAIDFATGRHLAVAAIMPVRLGAHAIIGGPAAIGSGTVPVGRESALEQRASRRSAARHPHLEAKIIQYVQFFGREHDLQALAARCFVR